MTAALYDASRIKRHRATSQEMRDRADFYVDYATRYGPVTVRQLYYRAEVQNVPGIDKTENGYTRVQRQVLQLRRDGTLGYRHIADLTRWMRKPASFGSVEEALRETARVYRKALWRDAKVCVEIWCEKDALAGVIYPVTSLYDVPLMVTRGFTSETFCFEAIEARVGDPRPYCVYYLGDFDRAGRDAAKSLWKKLRRFAQERKVNASFCEIAIEEADIVAFDPGTGLVRVNLSGVGLRNLPTREPKRKSAADRKWPHPFACELDAIEPDDLRALVLAHIEQHLPQTQLDVLRVAEGSERELILGLVGKMIDQ